MKLVRTAQGRVSELTVCFNVLECSKYVHISSSVIECVVYVLHPIKLVRAAQCVGIACMF